MNWATGSSTSTRSMKNLLLSNEGYQLNVVDTIAQNASALSAYRDKYGLGGRRDICASSTSELGGCRFAQKASRRNWNRSKRRWPTRRKSSQVTQQAVRLLSDEDGLVDVAGGRPGRVPGGRLCGRRREWAERLRSFTKDVADDLQSRRGASGGPATPGWSGSRLSELYTLYKNL